SGSVLGISLHRVKHRSEVPVAALPAYEESRVRQGVSAAGVTDAERILENLTKAWEQHCLIPDPAASPSLVPTTPTPRPTVLTPTPKPRVSGSPPAVTPRPTPTATPPADCAG
ncbi:MAG: hypothetical protein QOE64_2105, partial [Frankiales bacterium]|nr:hypothetical protein [Frankiales bacterium]